MDQFFCCSPAHTSVHRYKSFKTLPLPSAADTMKDCAARERHLKEFQHRAEQRWRMLHETHDNSVLLTPHEKLDEEDQEDVRAYQNSMVREIHLLRAAEELAKHLRGRVEDLHGFLHELCHEKNISLAPRDCLYCWETGIRLGLVLTGEAVR
jgi:hypothetical protein